MTSDLSLAKTKQETRERLIIWRTVKKLSSKALSKFFRLGIRCREKRESSTCVCRRIKTEVRKRRGTFTFYCTAWLVVLHVNEEREEWLDHNLTTRYSKQKYSNFLCQNLSYSFKTLNFQT